MSKIHRRQVLIAAGALLASPLVCSAQPQTKKWRIGYLSASDSNASLHLMNAFRAGLRERGYVDGQNIVIDSRWADGASKQLDAAAADLVRSKVALILAWGTQAVIAAKRATSSIPIVMTSVGDPVGAGLVASLARPGGNVTGVSNMDVGLAAKRLEILREILPNFSAIVVLRNPINPSGALQFADTQAAARSLNIDLQVVDVQNAKELESAFAAMRSSRAGAIAVLADPLFLAQRKQIAELAIRNRMPAIFARNENVESGGFISYGPTATEIFHHAAGYVVKILEGAKPADLPIEQPMKMELAINLKTAKALGVTISPSMLVRADQVIE